MHDKQTKALLLLTASDVRSILKQNGHADDLIRSLIKYISNDLVVNENSLIPLDIYNDDFDWDLIMPIYKCILKCAWRDIIVLNQNDIADVSELPINHKTMLLCKRISFCANKFFYIKELFNSLAENYRQINMQQKEFQKIEFEPYTADLKSSGRKKISILSKENIKILSAAFRKSLSTHYPLNKFILDNIPFEDAIIAKSESEIKIKAQFKKILKKEVWYYINSLPLNQSRKHVLLGYLFAAIGLSKMYKDYCNWTILKSSIADVTYSDWYIYLRSEARNI